MTLTSWQSAPTAPQLHVCHLVFVHSKESHQNLYRTLVAKLVAVFSGCSTSKLCWLTCPSSVCCDEKSYWSCRIMIESPNTQKRN